MSYNTPKETVEHINRVAWFKKETSISKTLALAFLGGAYIALGGLLAVIVGGGVPEIKHNNPGLQMLLFGSVFPVGLMLVAVAGAELFTGNTAYFVPSVLSKRMSIWVPIKNLGLVYFGNFIGAFVVAYFFAYQTHLLDSQPWLDSIMAIAVKKTSASFYATFLKGIVCNWLVAIAMWLAYASKDIISKLIGIWFPVMAFVAMGFEHSIANMFFIPTAMFYGSPITCSEFIFNNLIPTTLGNIVGGALFVGGFYWFIYDRKGKH